MPIDLYVMDYSPPARAVLTTAQVLGLEVNKKSLNLLKQEHKEPEYLKINPTGTVPAMVDNDLALFESRAIMTYLVDQYSPDHKLYPKDVKTRAVINKFLYFDCGTIFPAMGRLIRTKVFYKQDPPQEAVDFYKEKLALFETLLGENKFVTGDNLTLADISFAATLPTIKIFDGSLLTPKTLEYIKRVEDATPELKKLNAVLDVPLPL